MKRYVSILVLLLCGTNAQSQDDIQYNSVEALERDRRALEIVSRFDRMKLLPGTGWGSERLNTRRFTFCAELQITPWELFDLLHIPLWTKQRRFMIPIGGTIGLWNIGYAQTRFLFEQQNTIVLREPTLIASRLQTWSAGACIMPTYRRQLRVQNRWAQKFWLIEIMAGVQPQYNFSTPVITKSEPIATKYNTTVEQFSCPASVQVAAIGEVVSLGAYAKRDLTPYFQGAPFDKLRRLSAGLSLSVRL